MGNTELRKGNQTKLTWRQSFKSLIPSKKKTNMVKEKKMFKDIFKEKFPKVKENMSPQIEGIHYIPVNTGIESQHCI